MLNKIVSAVLNWFLAYVIIPITAIVVDYFRMKKTIKEVNEEINKLKAAKTSKEKDEAIDNIP